MTDQILNGLALGSTYAIVAVGLTLVFGVLNLLNFAHPHVFALGGMLLLTTIGTWGLPWPIAVIVIIVIGGLIGWVTEVLSFRRSFQDDDHLVSGVSSIALGMVIAELARRTWGAEPVSLPFDVRWPDVDVLGTTVSTVDLLIIVTALLLMAALDQGLRRSAQGRDLRAVAENRETATLLGIDVRRVVVGTFMVSAALAVIGGILLSLRIGVADFNAGESYGLRALAIIVIAGLGNVRGAMICGLLVGLVDVMTLTYLSQAWSTSAPWILLLVVLLVRPAGLFGTRLQRQSI